MELSASAASAVEAAGWELAAPPATPAEEVGRDSEEARRRAAQTEVEREIFAGARVETTYEGKGYSATVVSVPAEHPEKMWALQCDGDEAGILTYANTVEVRVEAFFEGEWYPGSLITTPSQDEAARWIGRWGVQCDTDEQGTVTFVTTLRLAGQPELPQGPCEAPATEAAQVDSVLESPVFSVPPASPEGPVQVTSAEEVVAPIPGSWTSQEPPASPEGPALVAAANEAAEETSFLASTPTEEPGNLSSKGTALQAALEALPASPEAPSWWTVTRVSKASHAEPSQHAHSKEVSPVPVATMPILQGVRSSMQIPVKVQPRLRRSSSADAITVGGSSSSGGSTSSSGGSGAGSAVPAVALRTAPVMSSRTAMSVEVRVVERARDSAHLPASAAGSVQLSVQPLRRSLSLEPAPMFQSHSVEAVPGGPRSAIEVPISVHAQSPTPLRQPSAPRQPLGSSIQIPVVTRCSQQVLQPPQERQHRQQHSCSPGPEPSIASCTAMRASPGKVSRPRTPVLVEEVTNRPGS